MVARLCQCLLEMGGFPDVIEVVLQWPQILPTDRKAEADTATALEAAGVSKDTVLTELGYDPSTEAEKRQAEGASVADLALQQFDQGAA